MSCQQVSRLITTTASSSVSSVTPEDPYVFTETVPAIPPVLFNTQKSRSKHSETQFTSATATATKSAHIQKLPLAPLNGNGAKSLQNSLTGITVNATITAATNFKNVTQSQKQQQLQNNVKFSTAATATNTNVCIVRKSQQRKHQLQNKFKQLLQKQPPPLQLQHTPSLWQTPLLLDTAVAAATVAVIESPPTSPGSLPASTIATDTLKTSTATPTTMPMSTTIVNTVAPSVCSLGTSSLPPSKFLHTTLAQHLQKVQCIKKPKKPASINFTNSSRGSISNNGTVTPPQSGATSPTTTPPLQTFKAPQHSDTDLNEIPVNVIFRKPQTTSEITRTLLGEASASLEKNENETLKKPATQSAVITSPATVVNSLKNVKIITPSLKVASPPSSVSLLPEAIYRPTLSMSSPSLISHNNLIPAPNVLPDTVFVQPITKRDSVNLVSSAAAAAAATTTTTTTMAPQAATISKHITSSMAMLNHSNDSAFFKSSIPAQKLQNTSAYPNKDAQLEKSFPTCTPYGIARIPPSSKPPALQKNGYKRKSGNTTATAKLGNSNAFASFTHRKNRKLAPVFSLIDSCIIPNIGGTTSSTAVAVVKMSAAEVDADTTLLASANVLPYCVQHHWLSSSATWVSALAKNIGREDRIAQHILTLRRQALQLLTTHSLLKLPLQAARRRLLCVDRLLRKYQNYNEDDLSAKKCVIFPCTNRPLEMASHCQQHISNNAAQHIFLACTAKFADNTQCRIPVFDITHDLPLCTEHARKRDAYNRNNEQQRPRKMGATTVALQSLNDQQRQQLPQLPQLPQQQQPQYPTQQIPHVQAYYHNNNVSSNKKANVAKATQPHRRKSNNKSSNTVGRPQKRSKKIVTPTAMAATNPTTTTSAASSVLLSAVLQRKSSTTSLESIASNSQSSSSQTHSSHHTTQQQYASNSSLAPPALAPLSNGSGNNVGNSCAVASHRMLNFGASAANGAAAILPSDVSDFKEINQIVAQFNLVANNNNNNNNNNNSCNNNMNFTNTNSNSYFRSSGLGGVGGRLSSSVPSTDDFLTQDMMSICENSSAYASSEDTGLGGISETEIMAGAQDADDIPLGDTKLLEDPEMVNALSSLPMDAIDELFTAVHQEEREEVDRALELVDIHLKTLQQTISSESDFLGDFFGGHDDILADTTDICSKMEIVSSVMHSPDTSGIDTSTLFLDSGSNSGGGSAGTGSGTTTTSNCPTVADIRGLVQT